MKKESTRSQDTASIRPVSKTKRSSNEISNETTSRLENVTAPVRNRRTEQPQWESESERVFELLQEDLIAGFFDPREILSETVLSKRFGASRTPIREAIVRLVGDRLLESQPHSSAVVREITPRDISQIYEMRRAVEVYALDTAGAFIEDDQLER